MPRYDLAQPRRLAWACSIALAAVLVIAPPGRAHDEPAGPIARLTSQIVAEPGNLALYLERAQLRRIAGDREGAGRDLDIVARRDADHPGLALCRGMLAMDRGDHADAIRELDRELALRPDDSEAHRLRAIGRLAAGDRRGAVDDLDAALRHSSRPSPDLYLERARLQVELGERSGALAGLDAARARLGRVPSLELYAIELELADGRAAAAAARLRALRGVYPDPAPLAGVAARIAAALPAAIASDDEAGRATVSEWIPDAPMVREGGPRGLPHPIAVAGDVYPINPGAVWKYLATPTAPPPDWFTPGYVDSAWLSGPAPLGYGEPNIATTVPYGPSAANKYPTTYFRTTFNVDPAHDPLIALIMSANYDDGFVAYLNGVEVARRGLPPGPVSYGQYAADHEGGVYEMIDLTASLGALVDGVNLFAVELHQSNASSSDLQWDMDLFYTDTLRINRGPYLQLGSSTAISVRWRTNAPSSSRVRYGASPDNLPGNLQEAGSLLDHEIRIEGLQPATRYYYSVGTPTDVLAGGATLTFVTAPVPGTVTPTRIWVIGDSGLPTAGAMAVRDAYAAWTGARGTDLWLMLGDNAYYSGTDYEYQAGLFDLFPTLLKQSVLWPTRGNHDLIHAGPNNDYYDLFTMPTSAQAGGVPSGSEAYYSFDWGDIHFICLDSHGTDRSPGGAMLTWLANDLAANTRRWVIAYWHHPVYSKGSHDSDNELDSGARMGEMRRNALPILEAAGVDLVLAGHSHSYERSFLIDSHYGLSSQLQPWMIVDGGDGRPDGDGPYIKPMGEPTPHAGEVHAVAGSGTFTSGGTFDHPAMVASHNLLGSMVLDIDGDRLDARFLDQTGAVLDSFAIVKSATIPVGVDGPVRGGRTLALGPGMPNPFTAETHISFTLVRTGHVRLSLLDAAGRRVVTLVNGPKDAGAHDVRWNGRDESGRAVATGVYLAVLEGDGRRVSRKIAYVR